MGFVAMIMHKSVCSLPILALHEKVLLELSYADSNLASGVLSSNFSLNVQRFLWNTALERDSGFRYSLE